MEWVDRMNLAISYVESHLCQEIDTDEISKVMACPFTVFQRYFVQITGIPLSEYIRRRKLTQAAYDIQNNNKILDVALKYGYESSDAFSVAFKRLHGVTPNLLKKSEVNLKFYARLYFTLSIKGVYEMDYRVVEKESFKVIGRRRTTPNGGGAWDVSRNDGSLEQLEKMGTGNPFLGLCFGFGNDGSNDNMVGMEYAGDDIDGLESFIYPASTWLVVEGEGAISDNILGSAWSRIYDEFLPQIAYKQAGLPTIENYIEWKNEDNYCKIEIRIPVEKQS